MPYEKRSIGCLRYDNRNTKIDEYLSSHKVQFQNEPKRSDYFFGRYDKKS